MRFAFDDEQILFRKNVRDVLGRACPAAKVREAWSSDTGRSRERWSLLTELGVVGALVPEAHGGLGMNELDLVLALEECGRAALPEPIAETAAIAVPMLRELSSEVADGWLARIASGDVIATVGLSSERYVSDAHFADLLLLQRGDELHAIAGKDVRLQPQRSVDGARRIFSLEWSPSAATRLASGDTARRAIAAAEDRASLAFAAELIGLARTLIDTTVAYAKVRTQFGQPIGSFQAVKHLLANAHLEVELAAPMVYRAAHSIAHAVIDRSLHASMAKARAGDAANQAARAALQVHGAIGYSFEHDLHLFMKRAWALAGAWGDAAHHRARCASAIFGTTEP
jgi:alkylation response protein AidB-like acyl-CoA dehydrogenase